MIDEHFVADVALEVVVVGVIILFIIGFVLFHL